MDSSRFYYLTWLLKLDPHEVSSSSFVVTIAHRCLDIFMEQKSWSPDGDWSENTRNGGESREIDMRHTSRVWNAWNIFRREKERKKKQVKFRRFGERERERSSLGHSKRRERILGEEFSCESRNRRNGSENRLLVGLFFPKFFSFISLSLFYLAIFWVLRKYSYCAFSYTAREILATESQTSDWNSESSRGRTLSWILHEAHHIFVFFFFFFELSSATETRIIRDAAEDSGIYYFGP